MSLALVAKEMNFTRPLLSRDNVILVVGGRHPLMEQSVETFVPNDTLCVGGSCGDGERSDDDLPSLCLVTGPNFSGKSVYLRQIALIAIMTFMGSFVPATSCVLGPIDRIFTRISSHETASVALSSFSADALQVSSALKYATPRSLVLMDEFGKGTDATDGQALLAAACLALSGKEGGSRPKAIIATNFGQVAKLLLSRSNTIPPGCSSSSSLTSMTPASLRNISYLRMQHVDSTQENEGGSASNIAQIVPVFKLEP